MGRTIEQIAAAAVVVSTAVVTVLGNVKKIVPKRRKVAPTAEDGDEEE